MGLFRPEIVPALGEKPIKSVPTRSNDVLEAGRPGG